MTLPFTLTALHVGLRHLPVNTNHLPRERPCAAMGSSSAGEAAMREVYLYGCSSAASTTTMNSASGHGHGHGSTNGDGNASASAGHLDARASDHAAHAGLMSLMERCVRPSSLAQTMNGTDVAHLIQNHNTSGGSVHQIPHAYYGSLELPGAAPLMIPASMAATYARGDEAHPQALPVGYQHYEIPHEVPPSSYLAAFQGAFAAAAARSAVQPAQSYHQPAYSVIAPLESAYADYPPGYTLVGYAPHAHVAHAGGIDQGVVPAALAARESPVRVDGCHGGNVNDEHVSSMDRTGRAQFTVFLSRFMRSRGTPIRKVPTLGGKHLDLYRLYVGVISRGGLKVVIERKLWKGISTALELPTTCTDFAFRLRLHYVNFLYGFERAYFHNLPCDEKAEKAEIKALAVQVTRSRRGTSRRSRSSSKSPERQESSTTADVNAATQPRVQEKTQDGAHK